MTIKELNAPFIQLAKYFRISAKEQKEMTDQLRLVSNHSRITIPIQNIKDDKIQPQLALTWKDINIFRNISPKKA